MAKWNYVFLIKWLFMSMILHYGCPEDFINHVCLETAINFAWSRTACWFTLGDAKFWLGNERIASSQKCQVKIDNLRKSTLYKTFLYRLISLDLRFDGVSKNLKTIDNLCGRSNAEERTLSIICNTSLENEVIAKDLCTSTKPCEDLSKICSQSSTEQIGVCVCRNGYIRFGNKCFKGLQLNESCQQNVECSGAVGLVCQNNTCVCRSGYIPLNDSSCFSPDISDGLCTPNKECRDKSKSCSVTGQIGICTCKSGFIGFGNECLKGNLSLNESCQRNEQCSMVLGSICENNTCVCRDGYVSLNNDSECSLQDSVVGLMVGAVIGGLILGIVLTVLGVIVYKNMCNGKPKDAKKKDHTAVVFNYTSYETERGADQNRFAEQRTNEKQIVNVPPFAHSVDLPGTKNARTHHGNKSSMMKSYDVNDDVYNHLHEKEEDSENDETYDLAHGNISSSMEDSDYSNLNTGIRYKEPDVSAVEVNEYGDGESPGDYCSLKRQ